MKARLRYINSCEKIDILIPNFDAELFNFIKLEPELLEELGIKMFLPTLDQFEERHKSNLVEFGKSHKIKVPVSKMLFSVAEIPSLVSDFTYPMVVKGKFYDASIAYNPEQVETHFNRLTQARPGCGGARLPRRCFGPGAVCPHLQRPGRPGRDVAGLAVTAWLIDKSALVRLADSPDAADWASRIERGLVRITTVTRLEVGYSARSGQDLRAGLRQPPVFGDAGGVPYSGDRGPGRGSAYTARRLGQHRAPSVPDLIIAATAELAGLAVLHFDKDFELIASITGQPVEWLNAS